MVVSYLSEKNVNRRKTSSAFFVPWSQLIDKDVTFSKLFSFIFSLELTETEKKRAKKNRIEMDP